MIHGAAELISVKNCRDKFYKTCKSASNVATRVLAFCFLWKIRKVYINVVNYYFYRMC